MPQPRLGLAGKWLAFENVLLHQPLLNEARIPFVGKVICLPENKNYRYHSIIKKKNKIIITNNKTNGYYLLSYLQSKLVSNCQLINSLF